MLAVGAAMAIPLSSAGAGERAGPARNGVGLAQRPALPPILCFFASLGPAESSAKTASKRSMYQADPEHLWNRLHKAMLVRVGPDGRAYGQDRLEPLLWRGSKHLLEGRSHKRAVALLEEFLKNKGEKLVEDPLKRAVLQRDLWLVFNWLEGDHWKSSELALKPEEVRAARDRLRRPLAAVIGRLALTPEQIKKLPDNYAAAVASGEFAKRFDPERPDKPYLPPDLFAADGPWVCLGRPDGPVAPGAARPGQGALALPVGPSCTRRRHAEWSKVEDNIDPDR
jgi:hypothetical protein